MSGKQKKIRSLLLKPGVQSHHKIDAEIKKVQSVPLDSNATPEDARRVGPPSASDHNSNTVPETMPVGFSDRKLCLISLSRIHPDPEQPRYIGKTEDEESIQELGRGMLEVGVLQPVLLRPMPPEEAQALAVAQGQELSAKDLPGAITDYYLKAGERRCLALRWASKTFPQNKWVKHYAGRIPAIVVGNEVSPSDPVKKAEFRRKMLLSSINENYHRRDLYPIELFDSLIRLRTESDTEDDTLSQQAIAHETGISQPHISRILTLEKLGEPFLEMVRSESAKEPGKYSLKSLVALARKPQNFQTRIMNNAEERARFFSKPAAEMKESQRQRANKKMTRRRSTLNSGVKAFEKFLRDLEREYPEVLPKSLRAALLSLRGRIDDLLA